MTNPTDEELATAIKKAVDELKPKPREEVLADMFRLVETYNVRFTFYREAGPCRFGWVANWRDHDSRPYAQAIIVDPDSNIDEALGHLVTWMVQFFKEHGPAHKWPNVGGSTGKPSFG